MRIDTLVLRTIYDSRVNPTVEAVINGVRAASPSGASTGTYEARCFVPEDLNTIEDEIRARVLGEDLTQDEFDAVLKAIDDTDNFANLGAVSIAASFAFRKAAGFTYGDQFPYPVGNLVGGGAHGGNTTIQEFLVIPVQADTLPAAMQQLSDMYHAFKDQYGRRVRGVNDEGAYVTNMNDEETMEAVKTIADEHGARVGIDAAASEYVDGNVYRYNALNMELPVHQQRKFMETLVSRYNLLYVEDPFHEDEFEAFADLTANTSDCLIVGDDTFVSNADRLQRGIDLSAGNSLIVKPNQVGTVSQAQETFDLATRHGYTPIISHRSGETCDTTIADLAVAWGAPFIKAGISGIRTAKNNQLLRLWDEHEGRMADLPV